MKDKFDLFSSWILGQGVEISDKSNAFQCMDLMYGWTLFLNFPKSTVQHGYAYQVFTAPTATTRQYFDIIPNSDTFVPQVGDIGVFNQTASNVAGHVCICNGVGNTSNFQSIDENWAGQTFVTLVTHSYSNFLGVLRPKILSNGITDQTIIPLIIDANGHPMEVQAIRSELADNEREITNLKTQIDLLLSQTSTTTSTSSTSSSSTTSVSSTTLQPPSNSTDPNQFIKRFLDWLKKIFTNPTYEKP